MKLFDRSKSLQQLEERDWGEPKYSSYLVTECHRLRRVPLREFRTEDLRILIGQNIGLEYLIVLALELLEKDPLAEGGYYPGDLLVNTLRIKPEFWKSHPELQKQASSIADRANVLVQGQGVTDVVRDAVETARRMFACDRGKTFCRDC